MHACVRARTFVAAAFSRGPARKLLRCVIADTQQPARNLTVR